MHVVEDAHAEPEFEMKVRLQRLSDGSYTVLGLRLDEEDEKHAPHGKPMLTAVFRWMRQFVLPGINLVAKMNWGFGQAILMDDATALATQAQFDALSEYSASFPSDTYVGKVWKRRHGDGWLLGEYVDTPDPNLVGVKWRELLVVEA
jgi:hypothetical protein